MFNFLIPFKRYWMPLVNLEVRTKCHIKNFFFSFMLSFPPFPSSHLPFLFFSPLLCNLWQYVIFKRTFSEWWQWYCELAVWVFSMFLSSRGSFVWVPVCSQLAWAFMDEFKLCDYWALGLVRAFQQPGCPFLWLKWVRPSRDQVLTIPDSYLERRHWLFTRIFTLCRIVQDSSLFYGRFDLNTYSIFTNK